eukprot:2171033-Lingulodinium_polyedra.AAC.1
MTDKSSRARAEGLQVPGAVSQRKRVKIHAGRTAQNCDVAGAGRVARGRGPSTGHWVRESPTTT